MLRTRVLTAAVGLPVLLLAVYAGGAAYALLVSAVALVACLESLRLLGVPPRPVPLGLGVLGTGVWLFVAAQGRWHQFPALFGGFLGILAARQVVAHPSARATETAAILLSSAYVGFALGHFLALRALPQGLMLTITAFLLTWAFDCAAYFVGRAIGRRRLAPLLSPGKTWEGALAGAAACVGVALVPWRLWPARTAVMLAAAGAVIVFSQLGDFWESSLKRLAKVKDSGGLLPGHGGILDRFDSLMFSVPAVYYLVTLLPAGTVGG